MSQTKGNSTPTIYQPLVPELHEIRLLRLHPSDTFEGALRCSLFCTGLSDPPPYEALSYVWGDLNFTQDVSVDGHSHKITRNLEVALRYLRCIDTDRILWIDALCIDQSNIVERNHQVTLMKSIYSQCERDIAWLGPDVGNASEQNAKINTTMEADLNANPKLRRIQEGMRLFHKIHLRDDETLDTMFRWQTQNNPSSDNEVPTNATTDALFLTTHQQSVLWILFRGTKLWRRVWIMQELSVSQNVVLVAGRETLDWDAVASFLQDENKPYADAFHVTGGHSQKSRLVAAIFTQVQTIQQQRRIMRDVGNNLYQSNLLDVLARFKYANARDERDLIYGLLGLVSEKHPIRVDYSKSFADVATDLTQFMINRAGNLDIIFQNPWLGGGETVKGLPSWVPDLTDPRRFDQFEEGFTLMLFAQRGIFSAGVSNCAVPCEVLGGNLLRTQGVIFDQVSPLLHEGYDRVGKDGVIHFARVYPVTSEPLFRAFWRTLVMDCKAYPIQRLSLGEIESDDEVFRKLLQVDFSIEGKDEEKRCRKQLVSKGMVERLFRGWTFARSKSGLMLMVREGVKEGDVLAVLDGGKVPCVLRPVISGETIRYKFINTAYVHGYMDGKAVVDALEGLYEKQEIVLI
ncbi:heterokaryon incompatibility protein-domain-containing protein [Xylariaceae sp. FL1272]|nr:heterokaryon incompatibility protein-domain-containing protein [Xylariaceae sp. FL1272]